MPFMMNISTKEGKTYKIESDSEALIDKSIGEFIEGSDFSTDLKGYKFKIVGASDKAGFPALENIPGFGLKRVLLSYGKGMKEKKPDGLRKRKTVRGKTISKDIVQINLKLEKEGEKKLADIFPEQNQAKPKEEKKE